MPTSRFPMFGAAVLLWTSATLVRSTAPGQTQSVDLVLHHGKIVTIDAASSIREAIAIRDGKVVAVGGNDLVNTFRAARAVDLHGKTVVPGFNDSHIHIHGNPVRWIDLAGLTSLADLKQKVTAKAKQLGPGEWITGSGWSEDELAEKRRPLRGDLDEAAPANPVILTRAGGHSAVANSLALKLASVTRETPDPEGGVIEHDANGELNGVIRERAGIVSRLVPEPRPDELRESFVANLHHLLSLGITSIIAAGSSIEDYRALWEAAYRDSDVSLPRAAVQIYWSDPAKIRAFGKKTGDGDERLRIGAVKILVDGGFTGPAAYTLEPYKNQPNYRGKLNLTERELYDAVKAGHEMGWQMGFHTIGDAAIKLATDVFERVLRESPRADHRHYLNHFTVMPPEATLKKIADNHILVAQQPNFTYTLEGRYVANLDGERLQRNNPLATLIRHGIFVALGSDVLPIGPMVGLYAAVTRKGMSGAVYAADEKIPIADAIRAYTLNSAYLTREEAVKGTLEPGKLADLIVLSDDILTMDPERIRQVTVEMTILGGKIVYEQRRTN